MMVVFDTNIFVSALVFPGGRADAAIRRILDAVDTLVVSPAIIAEVLGVLSAKFSRDREELSRVAVLLADLGEVVKPRHRLSVVTASIALVIDGAEMLKVPAGLFVMGTANMSDGRHTSSPCVRPARWRHAATPAAARTKAYASAGRSPIRA